MRRLSASFACLLLMIWFVGTRSPRAVGQASNSESTATASRIAGPQGCTLNVRSEADSPKRCYQCHGDVNSAFAAPFHHPVDEGRVTCSDCHDPHDSPGTSDLKSIADKNAVCARCHSETAGPFAYEHPAVKMEGCVSCHSPHGSPNARLLNVSDVDTLCLQCHSATNASAFPYAVSAGSPANKQPVQPSECVSCHTRIHGSNASDIFFK